MDPPLPAVVVCEENQTRAELYRLWLDTYDVRVALTEPQAREEIDDEVGVGIINQSFADGGAEDVLELVESRSPMARVVATRERSSMFPELGVDHQLVKPVFEDELADTVGQLIHRANFHIALKAHYRVAATLASHRLHPAESDIGEDQFETLERRADYLTTVIAGATEEMDKSDIDAVRRALTFEGSFEVPEDRASFDSKYLPPTCSDCGTDWSGATMNGEDPVVKLGAHVWRCRSCGCVHMETRVGSNQNSYRQ